MTSRKAFILTGEPSGEIYAAGLTPFLKQQGFQILGLGGSALRDAGAEVVMDYAGLSVVGISEVIEHYGELKQAFNGLVDIIRRERPDVLICIDFPDFNIRLAKKVRKYVGKLVYFVPPQVWAWRRYRARFLSQQFDRIFVLFPFEKPLYDNAEFLGHPLAETVESEIRKEDFIVQYGLDDNTRRVLLLPGSRKREFSGLIPVMSEGCRLIKEAHPDTEFLILLSSSLDRQMVSDALKEFSVPLTVVDSKHKYAAMGFSDVAIGSSGTVTLECGLMNIPMCALYKLNPISFYFGLLVVVSDYITIPNVVLDQKIFDELVNRDCTPENIFAYTNRFFTDKVYKRKQKEKLGKLRDILYKKNAFQSISQRIAELL